jgi:hypothetical protein
MHFNRGTDMITKSNIIIDEMGRKNFLESSTVWNYHKTKESKNVKTAVKKLFDSNPNLTRIVARIGRIGRTQHSATEVLLFDASGWDYDPRTNYYDVFYRN